MDTRLKEIVDNFEKMKIGVDEPFKFHCTKPLARRLAPGTCFHHFFQKKSSSF